MSECRGGILERALFSPPRSPLEAQQVISSAGSAASSTYEEEGGDEGEPSPDNADEEVPSDGGMLEAGVVEEAEVS